MTSARYAKILTITKDEIEIARDDQKGNRNIAHKVLAAVTAYNSGNSFIVTTVDWDTYKFALWLHEDGKTTMLHDLPGGSQVIREMDASEDGRVIVFQRYPNMTSADVRLDDIAMFYDGEFRA